MTRANMGSPKDVMHRPASGPSPALNVTLDQVAGREGTSSAHDARMIGSQLPPAASVGRGPELEEVRDEHRRRPGYSPATDHVRLCGHDHWGGDTRPDRAR